MSKESRRSALHQVKIEFEPCEHACEESRISPKLR